MSGGALAVLPLHGVVGFWDELVCLAIPLAVILGIGWAVLRGDTSMTTGTGDIDMPRDAGKD